MGRGQNTTEQSLPPRPTHAPASIDACVLPKLKDGVISRPEDVALEIPRLKLALAADGMGGPGNGDVAARAAAAHIESDAERNLPVESDVLGRYRWMQGALDRASEAVARECAAAGNKEAGATAVMSVIATYPEDGQTVALYSCVGDSRAYQFAGTTLTRLTSDGESMEPDSQIQVELDHATSPEHLSREGARRFASRNMVKDALGAIRPSSNRSTVGSVNLEPGDFMLLTTDGVHDNLTAKEIEEACCNAGDGQGLAEAICSLAQRRSQDENHLRAKRDDITAVVLAP